MERREFHHINKQEIAVSIETRQYRVDGLIDVLINHSITDELNNECNFIEVRGARIIDLSTGSVIREFPSLSLNKQFVVTVYQSAR
ncbi:MAG: hypothetical protein Kow0059_21850 [Candidatus Sumerlaeia bacterium]